MNMTELSKRALVLASPVALIATANPKAAKSMAHTRFEILRKMCKDGATPTVADLIKAGYRMDDVRHDSAHGFIAVGADGIAKNAKRVEAEKAAAIEAARKLLAEVDAK
jgi:hypothetical protein